MSFLSDWWEAAVLFTTYQRGKPQPPTCRGNAEGANLPAIASRSGEAGGAPLQISRRKDQAGSLGLRPVGPTPRREPKKRLQGRVIYIRRHSPRAYARGPLPILDRLWLVPSP